MISNLFLETPRLMIKAPSFQDFENLYTLQIDPDVMRYIGHGIRTLEDVKIGLEKAISHQEKYGFSLGAVFEKESGEFMGRAGLIYLAYDDTQPEIEVGYALHKKFWGKGYATELTNSLISWGFKNLSINKLVGIIQPANTKSRRVLEKADMHSVGTTLYNTIEVEKFEIYK